MKKLNGKLLDCVLLILCFCLLIIVIPKGVVLFIVFCLLAFCFFAMLRCNYFGR